MYPAQFFSLFPPFPRENRVFVAMSFDPRFDYRWNNVIKSGIEAVEINGQRLSAHRVDLRRISDSILTEILQGITNDRLVFADVTTLGLHEDLPVRNGNVMYEVGLAHAVRQPEEVLLFRSDTERLLFDVTHIRVNSYNPDQDPDAARLIVSHAIVDALRELDLKKSLIVGKAVESLGADSFDVLVEASQGFVHPVTKTVGDVLSHAARRSAISRLLDAGMLCSRITQCSPEVLADKGNRLISEQFTYELTPFGFAVMNAVTTQLWTPETLQMAVDEMTNQPATMKRNDH